MAKKSSIEDLQSDYETALAASQDDPDDKNKRKAANEAGRELQDARERERRAENRFGIGVVAEVRDE
jgi:hypothetical protein